jgi:hypothetical protein
MDGPIGSVLFPSPHGAVFPASSRGPRPDGADRRHCSRLRVSQPPSGCSSPPHVRGEPAGPHLPRRGRNRKPPAPRRIFVRASRNGSKNGIRATRDLQATDTLRRGSLGVALSLPGVKALLGPGSPSFPAAFPLERRAAFHPATASSARSSRSFGQLESLVFAGLSDSPGWTRTSNPPVNSRMLCQLSYRGSLSRPV